MINHLCAFCPAKMVHKLKMLGNSKIERSVFYSLFEKKEIEKGQHSLIFLLKHHIIAYQS